MPKISFDQFADNPLASKFKYNPKVIGASAYLKFTRNGVTQRMLHEVKYNRNEELMETLGEWYGLFLQPLNLKADFIIPVPLHLSKKRSRGFNQSEALGRGLSSMMGIPQNSDIVRCIKKTATQTKKTKVERWENMESVYQVIKPSLVEDKTLIVVDDVITTGATIGALCDVLARSRPRYIFVLALATGATT
ncbi:MAG: ComF family protein [Cyclobacteriaceae bacterium]|nr:ComF family protein [Cyclobacteriaceae bacterium HetDA_MAG_MS6]